MENQTHLNPNLGSESYFYASHLTSGCVPRFVVTLRLGIDEDILRIALDDIQQRFPQMSVQIQRTADGKNYELVDNPRPIPIFTDNGSVVRTMGTEQTNPTILTKLAQNHIEGMRKFRELDMTVEEKAILMDDKVRKSMENFTFVITNMGNITLPASMQQYIDEFYPILPTATCPYTIATTTWKGELMLSITQRSTDTSVCKRFVEILNDMDIPAYLADTFLFHTMEAKPL